MFLESMKNFLLGRKGGESSPKMFAWEQLPETCGVCKDKLYTCSTTGYKYHCSKCQFPGEIHGRPIPENEVYTKRQEWCPKQEGAVFVCH